MPRVFRKFAEQRTSDWLANAPACYRLPYLIFRYLPIHTHIFFWGWHACTLLLYPSARCGAQIFVLFILWFALFRRTLTKITNSTEKCLCKFVCKCGRHSCNACTVLMCVASNNRCTTEAGRRIDLATLHYNCGTSACWDAHRRYF